MTSRAVHVLVFEGFADWEPAHALAELRRSGNRAVVAVGFDSAPVTSMGGLRVVPDRALREIRPTEVEILIIPGGDLWEGTYGEAALNDVLTDLVSASGLAPIEFAREIFKQLRVFSAADEDLWFDMFKHGRLPQSAI